MVGLGACPQGPAPANRLRRVAHARGVRLSDEELLQVRLCDLELTLEQSRLARPMQRLYAELAGRGIDFKPHAWLAEDWFSPDGVPALPYRSTWRIRGSSGSSGA